MFALVAMSMVVSGAAELRSEAWVVVSQRSSVAKGTALDLARSFSKALADAGIPTPTPPEDLTSCGSKVPCLVKAAREKGVGVLVTLEVGSALDDLVVRVAAISVDEDGKVVQRSEVEGAPSAAAQALKDNVVPLFGPAVRTLLALPDPNAKPAEPEPKPEPKPEPRPERVVTAPKPEARPEVATEEKGAPVTRWVGVGAAAVGVVVAVVGVGLSVAARGSLSQRDMLCPPGAQCNDPKAYDYDASFRSGALTGGVLIGVGAAVAVGGLAVFLLSMMSGGAAAERPGSAEPGGDNPGITLAPALGPSYAGVSLRGRF